MLLLLRLFSLAVGICKFYHSNNFFSTQLNNHPNQSPHCRCHPAAYFGNLPYSVKYLENVHEKHFKKSISFYVKKLEIIL